MTVVNTVTCEECAFSYDAEHTKADGSYQCPLCEVERLHALMPKCPQCGLPYLDKACGPTHAALAEPMRRPGEAQRQRERAETVEIERDQLRMEIDRWQEESGLENSSGDPEGVTPDDLARHLQYLSKCEADLGLMEISHEQLMLACEELCEERDAMKKAAAELAICGELAMVAHPGWPLPRLRKACEAYRALEDDR